MDMATDLRMRMAQHDVRVAEVAALLGRTVTQVSRYRTGESPIPLAAARVLHAHGLLSAESILSTPETGDAA